jgi:hypothetical protein
LVAFGLIMIGELFLLIVVGELLALVPYLLWQRSPFFAALVVLAFLSALSVLWRLHLTDRPAPEPPSSGPQITMSRIPISGTAGTVYMTQFVVWALLSPAVGLFYAVLVSAAVLALPLIRYLHRPGHTGALAAAGAAVLGAACGALAVAGVTIEQAPLARILLVGVVGGVVAGPILLWLRSRPDREVSIAPYAHGGS